jgi:glycosyltransferase involved in cell wall biosynthesis
MTIDSGADRPARPPVLVVVAARDEATRVAATLAALSCAFPHAPVWLADDGSNDNTQQIARTGGARVVGGQRVLGKGGAMTAAALAAMAYSRDTHGAGASESIILLCDGDLAHSARELGALVDKVARGEADVAVAAFARRLGGGVGLARGFARWAIRRRCGFHATAPISGQRALSARALTDVLPFAPGYGMEIGITIDAVRHGHRVAEVELHLTHRTSGRDLGGFLHRARQLVDFVLVYRSRA